VVPLGNLPSSLNGSPSSSSISTPSMATATLFSRCGSVSESEVVVKDFCHDTLEKQKIVHWISCASLAKPLSLLWSQMVISGVR
jgi:hypothetical protein